ncbi:UDP-glucose 6-dehydrogenase OS=Streptomyces albaduncus OX=68172 GN=FHS32_006239 PE=3 SV=1 [Streptomyces griseoloalbus]
MSTGIEGSTGRLRFTTSWEEVAEFGDVHFVCVNTPQKHGEYACDMSFVDSAFDALAPRLTRPALVVGKSTVPVGSAARLAHPPRRAGPGGRRTPSWPGTRSSSARASPSATPCHPDRIIIGSRASGREKLLREVYAVPLAEGSPFVVTDFPTAELVKTSANSFLATKISFINAMAEVCEAADGDVVKPRLGHRARRPHREEVPAGRYRLRQRLPAQGHPRLHGARR